MSVHKLLITIPLLALVVAGCGDENVIPEVTLFDGVWKTAGAEGSAFLFEFEELSGDSLGGNLYVQLPSGDVTDPTPILDGMIEGERLSFTYDFTGTMVDTFAVDTVAFRGERTSEDVLSMQQYLCFADTCLTVPFQAVRAAVGF